MIGQSLSHLAWFESIVFKKFPFKHDKHASVDVPEQVSQGNVHCTHEEVRAERVYPRGQESKQYELLITSG